MLNTETQMTGWQNDGIMGCRDDRKISRLEIWHDDRKLCRPLTIWYILYFVCHTLHWPAQTTRPFLNILPFFPPTMSFASPNGGLKPKINQLTHVHFYFLCWCLLDSAWAEIADILPRNESDYPSLLHRLLGMGQVEVVIPKTTKEKELLHDWRANKKLNSECFDLC